ncbi:natural cytotoxicity triggering receptor 2 isoform X2 [Pseudophryne corroboree]|uniref:natural cytotoxicity triggering receptor 2 isoform X2 n=1 Tax=Pseudophryne corroboree TaxID=495146 RepID=UPI003081661F
MATRLSLAYIITLLGLSDWSLAKDNVYSGHLGETLTITCPYQQHEGSWGRKIWCKEVDVGFCETVVTARRYWQSFVKRKNGNTNIYDNKEESILTINMTNLQKSDTGIYQCRITTFGDINTLQRIQVHVLEDHLPGNVLGKVQHSISGSPSELQVPLTLVILGSSLLLCKLLLMGLICSWWKSQQRRILNQGSCTMSSSEQLLSSAAQSDLGLHRPEETSTTPYYVNYVSMGHLNQTH